MHSPSPVGYLHASSFRAGFLLWNLQAECHTPPCLFNRQAVPTVCIFQSTCVYLVSALQDALNGCWGSPRQSLDAACIVCSLTSPFIAVCSASSHQLLELIAALPFLWQRMWRCMWYVFVLRLLKSFSVYFLQLQLHLDVIREGGKLSLPQRSCLRASAWPAQIQAQTEWSLIPHLSRPCCLLQQVAYPDSSTLNLLVLFAIWPAEHLNKPLQPRLST